MALNFTIFNELTEKFKCSKCHHEKASTQFFVYGSSENACVSCQKCGFTEIYDYHILDEKYSFLR